MDDHETKIMARCVMENALYWMKTATHQELGKLGEMYVEWWLKYQGITVIDTSKIKHSGDINILTKTSDKPLKIEIKTSRQDKQGCYQFCLRKKGKTDISHSHYVMLLAVDNDGQLFRYLVPTVVFGDIRKCAITSHPKRYTGKLARYLIRDKELKLKHMSIGVMTA